MRVIDGFKGAGLCALREQYTDKSSEQGEAMPVVVEESTHFSVHDHASKAMNVALFWTSVKCRTMPS
ncbi:hypothetical protein A249_42276 [Pseudomonas syringae pv. actinidiae ICMP 18804]|uniref:Uncharacterized protein n=1 Tax=Pseudomonas syringae pv. actinidiae ICMP 19096 TaxID=1194405 RepID=A0A656JJQ6_PSESF|nr:hypothetical protein [Pseudomonas syringae]EPM64836.1 hypothetical protein A249_42276 [Pseudomonas syringae pv. actinidiae ICMP 18804]EPN30804.1 hypothetical protein A245_45328 [Pseudomonas syringae pv. actinidiae ICMP 19096]EPN42069.1 hypothetical protein A242_15741 [Pseudomonas syringae pv. actinidiae ICMP 19095]EPN47471.1 hypothetical protein A241_28141 [Pseudomonas syringae pv. actinidiae ICMP 19094]EPM43390.1 hypothetical protein A246_27369 [Pseudomonas syringae pv. actinidiae ICMP 190